MDIVSIVDYGVGNLFSVCRAVEFCGAKPVIIDNPKDIYKSEKLILPGVGAFADGMNGLRSRDLIRPLQEYAASGRFLLGICLGMQMLLTESEEFGLHNGLNIIPGQVKQIPTFDCIHQKPHKIPHIGWKSLVKQSESTNWRETVLQDILVSAKVYFAHSYSAHLENETQGLANCFYDGQKITAAIQYNNVFGCQFHPEKSGKVGLQILKNFISLKQLRKAS